MSVSSPPPSGTNRADAASGHQVNLLLYAAVPRREMLDQGFYAAEIAGLRDHPRVGSVTATNVLRDVRHTRVDGILSYFYSHSAAVGAIARLRGIPAIATGGCEQLQRDQAGSRKSYAARVAAFHGCTFTLNRLLATSTTDFERMRSVARHGRDKIELSFHGVAGTENADLRHFGSARAPGSLVTIAGLDTELNVRRKGVPEAVELLARFHATDPAATLTIIGRTTCAAMVLDHGRRLGVADRIRLAGYVTEAEKRDLLRAARFYVQLSEYEGFGIGALEALAQGCQVIHSNVGGLRDTIGAMGGDRSIVVDRHAVAAVDPAMLPAPAMPDWPRLRAHLAQFATRTRADAILRALDLSGPPA